MSQKKENKCTTRLTVFQSEVKKLIDKKVSRVDEVDEFVKLGGV